MNDPYGYKALIGRTIVEIRDMTDAEKEEMDWYGHCPLIILDNGDVIAVSQDDEGNGSGRLFC